MKQDNYTTRDMTTEQERHADTARHTQYAYRIYVSHGYEPARRADTKISLLRYRIASIVACFVKGATLIPTIGVWQGDVEHSTIVEVVALGSDVVRIHDIASALRCAFGQASVLVTHAPVCAEWVQD